MPTGHEQKPVELWCQRCQKYVVIRGILMEDGAIHVTPLMWAAHNRAEH